MLIARRHAGALGVTIQIDPNMVANAAATAAPRPGVVSTGDTGPSFSIQQHTWQQIYRERVPGYPDPNAARVLQQQAQQAQRALTAGLPPCPPSSVRSDGSCYGSFTPMTMGPNNTYGLLAPGTFEAYGVTFSVDQYKSGRFNRVYKPTAWQRRQAEIAVIVASQRYIFGDHGQRPGDGANAWHSEDAPRPVIGDGAIKKAIQARTGGFMTVPSTIMDQIANFSVDQMMALVPDIVLWRINFERNPIQPSQAERTQAGGWKAWLARGGYPLSKKVASGQMAVGNGASYMTFCASSLCGCSGNGMPSCIPNGFNSDGIGSKPSEGSFWQYISIYQDMNNPLFELTLVHNDPAWITRVGNVGAAFMEKLANAFCSEMGQGAIQSQINKVTADTCVNASGQPCTKGTPGCVCTPAPDTSKSSAGLFSFAAAKFCPAWAAEHPNPPVWEPPPTNTVVPSPDTTPPSVYPIGTIVAYDDKARLFRIAVPIGVGLGGVLQPEPTHHETTTASSLPAGVTAVSLTEYQVKTGSLPWYKNARVWAVIGGASAAMSVGGYALYRRRRSLTR